MAATFDLVSAIEPFAGQCPKCHEDVLAVEIEGQDVVVEVLEVLPTMRCPRCASNVAQGNGTAACWRCGGTRVVGEMLPSVGVAISPDGRARLWPGGRRREGEAILRVHACHPYNDAIA